MSKANLVMRKIPSLDFKYEISSDGKILRNAKSKRRITQFKKSHNSKTEYWCVQINHGHNHIKKHFIHNLVAECWLGPKPEGYQTDHIDRDSLNNDYRNLRYVTKSEQMLNRDYSKFRDKLLENLASKNGGKMVEVTLMRGKKKHIFPSTVEAARFLTEVYPDILEKSFRDKFHHRRGRIFDYDVSYRPYYPNCRD